MGPQTPGCFDLKAIESIMMSVEYSKKFGVNDGYWKMCKNCGRTRGEHFGGKCEGRTKFKEDPEASIISLAIFILHGGKQ
jgi:hypothetical protein